MTERSCDDVGATMSPVRLGQATHPESTAHFETEATAPVDAEPGDGEQALAEMRDAGAKGRLRPSAYPL